MEAEQNLFEHLELWDKTANRVLSEAENPESVDEDLYEWVLRLDYRARWLPEEERCEE